MRGHVVGVVLGFLLSGCEKENPEGALLSDPGAEFAFRAARSDVLKIKEGLGKGEDVMMSCAAAEAYSERLRKEKAEAAQNLADEVERLCGHDALIAWAETTTRTIETQNKISPSEQTAECAKLRVCLDKLQVKHKADSALPPLEERYARICR